MLHCEKRAGERWRRRALTGESSHHDSLWNRRCCMSWWSQKPAAGATSNIKPIKHTHTHWSSCSWTGDRPHTHTHTHAHTHTHTHTRTHAPTHTHTHTETIRSDCMRYTRVLGAGDLKGICVVLLCASIFCKRSGLIKTAGLTHTHTHWLMLCVHSLFLLFRLFSFIWMNDALI